MQERWDQLVASDDIVLVPGDISWASTPSKMIADLDWLSSRPGKKMLSPGNHDRWWRTEARMRSLLPDDMTALFPRWVPFHGGVIAATMGMTAPHDRFFNHHAERRWKGALAELQDLLRRLPQAMEEQRASFSILLMHYPPTLWDGTPNPLGEAIAASKLSLCVYGHIHQPVEWRAAWNGMIDQTMFRLGSADANAFAPIPVATLSPFTLLPATTPCALLL